MIAPFVLTAGLLMLPSFWDAGAHLESVSGNLLILLTMNAIGVFLVLQRQDIAAWESQWERDAGARVLAERALHELQTVNGIMPICSFCKRVRTEIGDWQQVESYVRARSTADFSHGVCPACAQEHYADLLSNDEPSNPRRGSTPSS